MGIRMKGILIFIIIILVLIFVLIGVCYIIYRRVSSTVRFYSNKLFGTPSVRDGINIMEAEYAATPKSVSAATSLCLPRIVKDFPDFHYEEMRDRAENVLISYLRSIDSRNSLLLTEGTSELKKKLDMQIEMMNAQGIRSHYDKIKVHRTEINQYRKDRARCSIIFQSAIEYVFFAESQGNVIAGRKETKTQTKYNIELIYIQDRDLIENTQDKALGVNCPNCGAPLSGVGAKICAYCDTPMVEFNIRTWHFGNVEEVN